MRVPVVIMVIMVSVGRGVLCVRVGEREEMEGRHLSAISGEDSTCNVHVYILYVHVHVLVPILRVYTCTVHVYIL